MKPLFLCGLIFLLSLFTASPGYVATGDFLYVIANVVNVRESPSIKASIMMTVQLGHKVVEISRQGKWIEVGIARTGQVGWIHSSLLGSKRAGGKTTTSLSPEFKKFSRAFASLNNRIESMAGVRFFTGAEDIGDGILYVKATQTWISASRPNKKSNLNTILKLWKAANNNLPVVVYILDPQGNKHMWISSR